MDKTFTIELRSHNEFRKNQAPADKKPGILNSELSKLLLELDRVSGEGYTIKEGYVRVGITLEKQDKVELGTEEDKPGSATI